MFSVATAVCIVLALSNGEIPIPSPLPNSSEPPWRGASFDRSDVTRYYVVDDVAFPPGRHTGAATNWKNAFPPRRHTGATANWKNAFPPGRHTGATTNWKNGAKSRRRGSTRVGYLRMRSKYRDGRDSSDDANSYSSEYWIKRAILNTYDRNTLPARTDAATIPLYVAMSLYHILDTVTVL